MTNGDARLKKSRGRLWVVLGPSSCSSCSRWWCLRSSASAITRARSRTSWRNRWAGRCGFPRWKSVFCPGQVFSRALRPERCRRSRLRRRTRAACQRGHGVAPPAGVMARTARNRQDQRGRRESQPGACRSRAMEPGSPFLEPPLPKPASRLGYPPMPASAAASACLRLKPLTCASISRTARKNFPSRCSTPTSHSGKRVPASGASACAASPRALT